MSYTKPRIRPLLALMLFATASINPSQASSKKSAAQQANGSGQTAPKAAQPMQSAAMVTGAAQSAASPLADYSVCSLPPYAQGAFQEGFRMGFFVQEGKER